MKTDPIRLPARSLGAALAIALVSACHEDGGGNGGGGGGVSQPLLVDFALRTDLHLGSAHLGDLLHVDLNLDGADDLVEGNFGTRFVTIALGNVDGSFSTIHELATVGHAFRLATGDLDANGLEDVAVACGDWIDGADQAVQVFPQGPNPGEFGPSLVFDLDTDPKDLCSAPIGGRAGGAGPDELFVALRDAGRVLRLELQGGILVETGTLDSTTLGLGGPFSLAALDVGGDGWIDLVVGEDEPGTGRVVEYPRTAAGFQAPLAVLAPVKKPVVDATGDVDGNGFEDLAVAQFAGSEVFLLAGDPAGLSTVHPLDFGGETTSLLFRDLDGDGLAEAVGTVFFQQSLQVRRGLGPFAWDDPVHYNVGVAPRAIGVLRVAGDTTPDLLCANAQDLSLLLGNGDGSFRGARGYSTGRRAPIALETADLDGDGDLDAVAITRFQEALVLLENRAGELVAANVLELQAEQEEDSGHLALADFDHDGDVDALATVYEERELRLYRNGGDIGRFQTPQPLDVLATGAGPLGVDLADLDGDGHLDIVLGNVEDRTLQVFLGTGAGSFHALAPQALGFAPYNLLAADFDGDGRADVAVTVRFDAPAGAQGVLLLAGDGAGGLEIGRSILLSSVAGGFAQGDLDENGTLDLVVGQFDLATDELMTLRNQGGFVFAEQPLALSPGPGTPLVADLDEDGHLDLLVPTTAGELELVLGDGTGAFQPDQPRVRGALPCAEGTISATLADLDGDRLPELLMVTPGAPFVWVARNTSLEQGVN